jgi:3-oxoacyl-[acyl-carrier protein] reductase
MSGDRLQGDAAVDRTMHGKVAIVTGAGRGIGRAIALRLAADGARVVVAERDDSGAAVAEELRAAIRETPPAAAGAANDADGGLFVRTDVSDPRSVAGLVSATVNRWGRIDVLVNNAAVSLGEAFLDTSLETWNTTLAVNLTGAFLCGQAVARTMVERAIRGRIVNVASVNSHAAERCAASYVASKGGLAQLTRAMAVDLGPHAITANAVAPGPIETEATAALFAEQPYCTGIERGVPLARPGTAREVAAAVRFLVSDEAAFVNGTTLVVDGGFLAYARLD